MTAAPLTPEEEREWRDRGPATVSDAIWATLDAARARIAELERLGPRTVAASIVDSQNALIDAYKRERDEALKALHDMLPIEVLRKMKDSLEKAEQRIAELEGKASWTDLAALERERDEARAEVEQWKEQARQFCQNADYWRAKAERAEPVVEAAKAERALEISGPAVDLTGEHADKLVDARNKRRNAVDAYRAQEGR